MSSEKYTRRDFIKAGTISAAVALSASSLPRSPGQESESKPRASGSFELEEVTLEELRRGLESGLWTSRKLVEMYLQRIETLDQSSAGVNSVLELNPQALQVADQLDREMKENVQ